MINKVEVRAFEIADWPTTYSLLPSFDRITTNGLCPLTLISPARDDKIGHLIPFAPFKKEGF
jgi:hypothetical protein